MPKKAFTLLEILIVIAVGSLFLSLSIGPIQLLRQNMSLSICAKQIALTLRKSQIISRMKNTDCRILLQKRSSQPARICIYLQDQPIEFIHLPNAIDFAADKEIRFSINGLPLPGYFGTIHVLAGASASKDIIISSAGRIRVQ